MKDAELLNIIKVSRFKHLASLVKQNYKLSEIINYITEIENKNKKSILLKQEKCEQILENCIQNDIKIISILHPLYPEGCKEIHNAPAILYAKGNCNLLTEVKFAIIGARAATFESLLTAERFAKELSEFGFCIVSGFAYGVDTYACKGALKHGTIQVLGSGVNVVYPKQNTKLYDEVLQEGGLFLSELEPSTQAMAEHFPLRNRIISSISKGVLLVQASKKNKSSGSLITARICLEQEKDLFAIPGHPIDDKFSGGNDLIKNGNAIFTTTPKDVLDMIGYHLKGRQKKSLSLTESITDASLNIKEADSSIKNIIKTYLSTNPISIDELCLLTKINIRDLEFAIMEMELLDEVRRHPSGKFSISMI